MSVGNCQVFGKKSNSAPKSLCIFCQVLGQFVFTGEATDLREGVDALVGLQLCDFVVLNADIGPPDVPVGILVRKKTDFHLAANTLDHVVVTVLCT